MVCIYTVMGLLNKFIKNEVTEGITNGKTLRVEDSKLFYLNKCLAIRKFNKKTNRFVLFINLHRYGERTQKIQNYLIKNSVFYNRTVISVDNENKFYKYLL